MTKMKKVSDDLKKCVDFVAYIEQMKGRYDDAKLLKDVAIVLDKVGNIVANLSGRFNDIISEKVAEAEDEETPRSGKVQKESPNLALYSLVRNEK